MKFQQMKSSEKDDFLSQEAENPEFARQTNGQVLYAEIVKSLKKRYAPDKEKNLEENVAEYKKQFGNILKSEIQTTLTSIEITARKQESDQRKQKFAALKAHILNPESGKNTEIAKDKFNPFIKNYLEQNRSK